MADLSSSGYRSSSGVLLSALNSLRGESQGGGWIGSGGAGGTADGHGVEIVYEVIAWRRWRYA